MARTWKDSGYRGGRNKSGGKRKHGHGNGIRATNRVQTFDELDGQIMGFGLDRRDVRSGNGDGRARLDSR